MALTAYIGNGASSEKHPSGADYILCGISGGVQSDGSESWSVAVTMKQDKLSALKSELVLGKLWTNVFSGISLPSKNTGLRVQGWDFSYKKGGLVEATIRAGIDMGTEVTFSSSRIEVDWVVEVVQEDIPLVEVSSYWTKIPVSNTATNRAKVFAVATSLANIEFNGLMPERGAQWQATAREILGSSSLTADTFRANIPADLLARIQSGNITMRLGAYQVTRRRVAQTYTTLQEIGTSSKPDSSRIKLPSNTSGVIMSDIAEYSASTGFYTQTTVWKVRRQADD